MPSKPPSTIAAPYSSNPEVLARAEEHEGPQHSLRERHLNTPACLLENLLGCFAQITVLMLFAFLESTTHITSREGLGREKADNRHYYNGYAFKTSWGWGEMPQWVKYTFPWGTIMGGLKKIRWSTEGSPWRVYQGSSKIENKLQYSEARLSLLSTVICTDFFRAHLLTANVIFNNSNYKNMCSCWELPPSDCFQKPILFYPKAMWYLAFRIFPAILSLLDYFPCFHYTTSTPEVQTQHQQTGDVSTSPVRSCSPSGWHSSSNNRTMNTVIHLPIAHSISRITTALIHAQASGRT